MSLRSAVQRLWHRLTSPQNLAWVPYESEPEDWATEDGTLRDHLNWFLSHPSEAMDRFCEQVLAELTKNADVYWVHEAVSHASLISRPDR